MYTLLIKKDEKMIPVAKTNKAMNIFGALNLMKKYGKSMEDYDIKQSDEIVKNEFSIEDFIDIVDKFLNIENLKIM